jgi:hypothetical protein
MTPRLTGRQLIMLAEDLYEDLELWYPVLRFREEGARVVIAGPDAKPYAGKHGYPVTAEAAVRAVEHRQFDGVIVPGGYAPEPASSPGGDRVGPRQVSRRKGRGHDLSRRVGPDFRGCRSRQKRDLSLRRQG